MTKNNADFLISYYKKYDRNVLKIIQKHKAESSLEPNILDYIHDRCWDLPLSGDVIDENINKYGQSQEERDEFYTWIKKRALEYVLQGDLKQALDSIWADYSKNDKIQPELKHTISMMCLALRYQPNLSEKEVVDFINGVTRE